MNTIFKNDFVKKLIDSFIGKAAYSLFLMLFTVVCTRMYGVEVFGEFTYAFTIVTMAMLIAKAGMDMGLIYSIPQNGNKDISFSIVMNFIISIALIASLYFVFENAIVRIALPLIWLYSLEQLLFGVYKAYGEIRKFYLINSVYAFLIRLVLTISLFYFNQQAISIVLAVYGSFIVSIVLYLYEIRNKITKFKINIAFLKYSIPLSLASFLGVFLDRIDILMIGEFEDAKSVGIYQVITQISMVLLMILFIFNTVFAPKISQLYHSKDFETLKKIYVNSTRVLCLIAILFLFITCVGGELILSLFGSEAITGEKALIYRTIGQVINVSVGVVWSMLAMTGNTKSQLYLNIGACILNILLNLMLIPEFGINGAAIASMLTVSLINIIGYILVRKKFNIRVFKIF